LKSMPPNTWDLNFEMVHKNIRFTSQMRCALKILQKGGLGGIDTAIQEAPPPDSPERLREPGAVSKERFLEAQRSYYIYVSC